MYYYYIFNAQGDVTGILDSLGNKIVTYDYNAWGSPCGSIYDSTSNHIGTINPIRYRGYYYDAETGFYYLQARYYDPTTCRFINADDSIDLSDSIIGSNLFAYCENNPIMFIDPSGQYSRKAAVNYANKYWFWRNHAYRFYMFDCANFVSQCLAAGGIEMNEDWHSYKTFNQNKFWWDPRSTIMCNYWYDWDVTDVWNSAEAQFEYFADPDNGYINGGVITIYSASDIADVADYDDVQAGDLLYFVAVKKKRNETIYEVHHATIITKVQNGKIYYAAHTNSRKGADLSKHMRSEIVYIVRIRDDA